MSTPVKTKKVKEIDERDKDVSKLLKSLKTYCDKKEFTELTKTHRRYLSKIAIAISVNNFDEENKIHIIEDVSKTLKLSTDITHSKMEKCLKEYKKSLFYNKIRDINQKTIELILEIKSANGDISKFIIERSEIYIELIEKYIGAIQEYYAYQKRKAKRHKRIGS